MDESERYAAVTSLDRRTVRRLWSVWWGLSWASLQDEFVSAVPELVAVVAAAQMESAAIGAAFVNDQAPGRDVTVKPAAFAQSASDGRPMVSLLSQALVAAFAAARGGAVVGAAMQVGADSLDRIATTQLWDAERAAEQVTMAAHLRVRGWRRSVEPGACGRCIVLAGRVYRWSEGFDRHPRCRCSHSPVTSDADPEGPTPQELFDRMPKAQQDRAFTVDGAEAIRRGADPAKVINARRGMATAASTTGRQMAKYTDLFGKKALTTTEGAKGKKAPVRLMPESILKYAESREQSIELLRLYGYIN